MFLNRKINVISLIVAFFLQPYHIFCGCKLAHILKSSLHVIPDTVDDVGIRKQRHFSDYLRLRAADSS